MQTGAIMKQNIVRNLSHSNVLLLMWYLILEICHDFHPNFLNDSKRVKISLSNFCLYPGILFLFLFLIFRIISKSEIAK